MSALKRDGRCYFCGTALPSGTIVRWFCKPAKWASRYKYIPERNVPCCEGEFAGQCEVDRKDREEAARQAKIDALFEEVKTLLLAGKQDAALELLTGGAA
jgi:hypothetical protein